MIESTRRQESASTVVLVHPHGRLASALSSDAFEVASILDAVGIIARGGDQHAVSAVVVDRQQLDRFPDAAPTIKRLDDQVRIIEIAEESSDALGDLEVDARLDPHTAAAADVQAAVSGHERPTSAPAPAPAPDSSITTWPFEPATAPPAAFDPPPAASDMVDEEERRALTGAPSADGDAPPTPASGFTPLRPTNDASSAGSEAPSDRPSPADEATDPGAGAGAAAGDADHSPHIDATLPPGDDPPPLSFAEAVRARESQYDAGISAPVEEPLGDVDLVEAVLAGDGRIQDVATQLIREQTGWQDLVLDPPSSEPTDVGDETTATDRVSARVADEHHEFGALRSTRAGRDELELWAGWLSRWLELGRRHDLYRTQSRTDELTGACNRREMFAFLDETLAEARARRQPVTVMVFDIDDFKRFNDEHGHAAGDTILRETVALLRSVIRRTDRVCRIGGDEFAVIFADLEGPRAAGSSMLDDIAVVVRRFQAQVRAMAFPRLGLDAPGMLSISAGLASYPWDGTDAETLLQVADQRALESKRRGKNHITLGPGVVVSAEDQDARPHDG